jgi:phosphate transport system substrate-binding protein
MSKYKKLMCLLAMGAVLGITGCGSSDNTQETAAVEGLDKMGDVQVIAREAGSGTRSTFAQLADFESDGEDSSLSDLTTEDAVIANNAAEVIEKVEENKTAIGYVSQGALEGNENLKTLKIGGVSYEDDKTYPLSRSFYLAYSGELDDLEQDFLVYVHGAGQEIVSESYVSVAKSSSFLSNMATGTLTIEGSTSVAPLMQELVEAYEQINTNAQITVTETDSTQGLTQAMSGECDFGMSSRDLKDYETELLDYETIAKDNIVVVIGKDNPLEDISLDELKSIYTGETKTWGQLNS